MKNRKLEEIYNKKQLKLKKIRLNPNFLSSFLLFYNILSNCHNSDEINYLLNAFRLKKNLTNVWQFEITLVKNLTQFLAL